MYKNLLKLTHYVLAYYFKNMNQVFKNKVNLLRSEFDGTTVSLIMYTPYVVATHRHSHHTTLASKVSFFLNQLSKVMFGEH